MNAKYSTDDTTNEFPNDISYEASEQSTNEWTNWPT